MNLTESEFDALLRRALLDVIHEDYADILEGEPDVPPHTEKYLRRKRKLLADPFGYVRRLARPVWKKTLRMVACILLVLATLFGTVMAVSPSARAWVVERIVYWTENFTKVSFTSYHPTKVSPDWRPSYIPAGFEETDSNWDESLNLLQVTYKSTTDSTIFLTCQPASQGNTFNVDNEHSDYYPLEINGHTADLFISDTPGFPNRLLWSNTEETVAYMLTSTISYDELLSIARSN